MFRTSSWFWRFLDLWDICICLMRLSYGWELSCFLFFAVLGFELRVSSLLGRCSTALASAQAPETQVRKRISFHFIDAPPYVQWFHRLCWCGVFCFGGRLTVCFGSTRMWTQCLCLPWRPSTTCARPLPTFFHFWHYVNAQKVWDFGKF
jgi:hypothetical protein